MDLCGLGSVPPQLYRRLIVRFTVVIRRWEPQLRRNRPLGVSSRRSTV